MPKPTQANRFLHIQSVLGEDALIISRADGQESLGRLYEIRVEFTAERDDLDLDALLVRRPQLAIVDELLASDLST